MGGVLLYRKTALTRERFHFIQIKSELRTTATECKTRETDEHEQTRGRFRNGKSGHIDYDRTRPSEKTHLSTGVRNAAHSRTLSLGSCDYR